jgi:hypothetical protein
LQCCTISGCFPKSGSDPSPSLPPSLPPSRSWL